MNQFNVQPYAEELHGYGEAVPKSAEEIAQEIHDLRIEMNEHVDRIDSGLRGGDIQEANLGKRKLSGVVKRFGFAIDDYKKLGKEEIR